MVAENILSCGENCMVALNIFDFSFSLCVRKILTPNENSRKINHDYLLGVVAAAEAVQNCK